MVFVCLVAVGNLVLHSRSSSLMRRIPWLHRHRWCFYTLPFCLLLFSTFSLQCNHVGTFLVPCDHAPLASYVTWGLYDCLNANCSMICFLRSIGGTFSFTVCQWSLIHAISLWHRDTETWINQSVYLTLWDSMTAVNNKQDNVNGHQGRTNR